MAKRHFDEKGFPQLDLLIAEICSFYEGGFDKVKDALIHRWQASDISREGRGIAFLLDMMHLRNRVMPVNGIYVVGSQSRVLPDDYLHGDHDLDVKVDLALKGMLCSFAERVALMNALKYWLNDEVFWKLSDDARDKGLRCSREHFIDIYLITEQVPLETPYLRIYPSVTKVE